MNVKGYSRIPNELFYWITFLTKVLPLRSVGTFLELLIGAMLTPTGFVTEAYLMLDMRNHWTSYYQWLQQGKWSWLALARQFVRLCLTIIKNDVVHLAIDDTLTLGVSSYVRGQCWVSLAMDKAPLARPR